MSVRVDKLDQAFGDLFGDLCGRDLQECLTGVELVVLGTALRGTELR
jgi:hypothetical protein